nr:hypothetical protein [Croceibacterium salegens]
MYVKLGGEMVYLRQAVDQQGEIPQRVTSPRQETSPHC